NSISYVLSYYRLLTMQKLPFVYVVLVGSQKLLYRKEVFIAKAFLTPTSKTCGLFNVVNKTER
ncbi:MAG: hypothetical protein ABF575_09160, partial [Liquorilactobacillus hordei]|uniref:hypothetical protein n=1 Tax=Liquorilactobacillus hordei TaxID=468911 RepID=UPI0039ED469D